MPDAPVPESSSSVSAASQALLDALAKEPGDETLRERAARALLGEGAWARASELLAGHARLNAHDPGHLPCLCRACVEASPAEAEMGGVRFFRDLVLEKRRVLFFWAPEALHAEATPLRNSVRGSLVARLRVLERRRKKGLERPAF
jgi:hypothetical protein